MRKKIKSNWWENVGIRAECVSQIYEMVISINDTFWVQNL